jgi:hypothetical protein
MENKKMYVITMGSGSYDDYNLQVLFVTDDFDKGSDYVNNKNENYQSLHGKMEAFYMNEYKQWQLANPRPAIGDFVLKPIPKWKSKEKITKDMRVERDNLLALNKEIARKAQQPMHEWMASLNTFITEWRKTHLTSEELEMANVLNESVWYIEEAQWL